jgi:hypothetical protein
MRLVGGPHAIWWPFVAFVFVMGAYVLRSSQAPPRVWLVFAAVSVYLVVGIIAIRRHEERRVVSLSEAAEKAGLTFEGDASPFDLADEQALVLLRTGSGRWVHNVMRGRVDGRDVVLFDLQYVAVGGRRGDLTTFDQTVAAFRFSRRLPEFQLTPRQSSVLFQDLLAPDEVSGLRQLDFSSHPRFAQRWLVRGREAIAIRKLFGRPVIEFFQERDPAIGWVVEGGERWLLAYQPEQRVAEGDLASFARRMARIALAFAAAGADADQAAAVQPQEA